MPKILVVGATNGRYRDLAKKVAIIDGKHGPFDMVLCTGDFFSDDETSLNELLSGQIEFPVTTYFITGKHGLPESIRNGMSDANEVCSNLVYLGKQGILTTSDGIRIAFLGGIYDQDAYNAEVDPEDLSTDAYIHKSSVTALMQKLAPIDILLTNPWPQDITKLTEEPSSLGIQVDILKNLVIKAEPRYIFAGQDNIFYERAPYINLESRVVTRFLSLGHVGNTEKVRWFYAFSLSTTSDASIPPPNATLCPLGNQKRPREENNGFFFATSGDQKKQRQERRPPTSYVCRICHETGHYIQDCPNKATRERVINPNECWFCLANPNVTKHLIVSIGTEAYLTLPKGQLLSSSAPDGIPGGGHVLIIPMEHYATFGLIEPKETRGKVMSEVKQYKDALRELYSEYDHSMVSFQVSRLPRGSGGGHAHIQVVPIEKDLSSQVEAAFRQEAEHQGYELEEREPTDDVSYFCVQLPDGKVLTHVFSENARFNLQFGRIAIANLLEKPERADWKACAMSDKEEKADAIAFKKAFKRYDFTLL